MVRLQFSTRRRSAIVTAVKINSEDVDAFDEITDDIAKIYVSVLLKFS